MKLVFRVDLDFGHRLKLRCIEGRHVGFGRAKLLEMLLRCDESPVISERRPVAPREAIGSGGGFDGFVEIARVAFDLRQHVAGIRMKKRIRSTLGGVPNVIQKLACFVGLALLPPQLGERNDLSKQIIRKTEKTR